MLLRSQVRTGSVAKMEARRGEVVGRRSEGV